MNRATQDGVSVQNKNEIAELSALSESEFVSVMCVALDDELATMTSEQAQRDANADFITEQQMLRMELS
jgi:hypothetical protein